MLKNAFNIQESVFGDHHSTAFTYINVWQILLEKGDNYGDMEMNKKGCACGSGFFLQVATRLIDHETVLGDHPDVENINYINIVSNKCYMERGGLEGDTLFSQLPAPSNLNPYF